MTIKPVLIVMDETQYWTSDVVAKAGRIYCTYLYDEMERTYCCELTPSYCLYPLYYTPLNYYTDETLRDELEETLLQNFDGDVRYYHVRDIERIDPQFKYFGQETEDTMDEVIEGYQGNVCLTLPQGVSPVVLPTLETQS